MFCLNIWRSELAGFIARKEDHAPGFLRIAFKHIAPSPLCARKTTAPNPPARNDRKTPVGPHLIMQPACHPTQVPKRFEEPRLITKGTADPVPSFRHGAHQMSIPPMSYTGNVSGTTSEILPFSRRNTR